jgi:hypothetical protein
MMAILSLILGGIGKAISSLFTFFTTKPGIYVGILLICLGAIWYVHHRGYTDGVADERAGEKIRLDLALAQARADEDKRRKISTVIVTKYIHDKVAGDTVTKTIIEKVPVYVTPKVDQTFPMPCSLIRVRDAAVLSADPGDLPYTAPRADDTACPVTASVVATRWAADDRAYLDTARELIALQDWVHKQESLKLTFQGAQSALHSSELSVQTNSPPSAQEDQGYDTTQKIAFVQHGQLTLLP